MINFFLLVIGRTFECFVYQKDEEKGLCHRPHFLISSNHFFLWLQNPSIEKK